MQRFMPLLVLSLTLAGCSSNGASDTDQQGAFALDILDSLAGGQVSLDGVFLHGANGWIQALGNGTTFNFEGTGTNVSASGDVPAGSYDRLRLLFDSVTQGDASAALTQSGVELLANITVAQDGATRVGLAFAWPDAFFRSAEGGVAFTPVLSLLTVTVDGQETLRLEASEIATSNGKAPVARMRIFDPTGLEVFASTFVADSPKNPVIGNAGNIAFSATASELLQPGTTMKGITWDISGTTLTGNTVVWQAPINGGNHTVRLTVQDSDGNEDTQTVRMALRPGTQTRTVAFAGAVTDLGAAYGDPTVHTLEVDTTSFNNATANLTHVKLVLAPGSATVPYSNLDVALADGAGTAVGSGTGQGSQHTIDKDVVGLASGAWAITVSGNPAYEAQYSVTVTLTWKGVNPGIEAFLASYDDGHSHQH